MCNDNLSIILNDLKANYGSVGGSYASIDVHSGSGSNQNGGCL